jgi:Ala-tRNA(Pro) deacylase
MDDILRIWLAEHSIKYTLHTHPAVFTVPEAKIHCGYISGTHCKNLVLKDKKTGHLYLITIPYNKKLDLNRFRKMISAPKVRFADENDLSEILGISAGAVSPLALINDKENSVIFWIDKTIWDAVIICCHPNINTETLQIPNEDFHKLIKSTGNLLEIKEDIPYVSL